MYDVVHTKKTELRDIDICEVLAQAVHYMIRKIYPVYVYKVIRVRGQVSLVSQNFGPRPNFSFFICVIL